MKKSVKSKWVKALRSGQYEQGKRHLKTTNNKYCCLGVLCDVLKSKWYYGKEECGIYDGENYEYGVLPNDIRKELKIDNDKHAMLIKMNDRGDSFKRIAAYIERYM